MSHYHTEGHPNYLTVPTVKNCKEETENSIHGAELKQNNVHGADLKTVYVAQSWNKEDKKIT